MKTKLAIVDGGMIGGVVTDAYRSRAVAAFRQSSVDVIVLKAFFFSLSECCKI